MSFTTTNTTNPEHWVQMQVKTFTKWFNSKLTKGGYCTIKNLFEDLRDGTQIYNLLECLHRNPPAIQMKPMIKIQKMENVNTLLDFIKSRGITLVNIGAEDIVYGDEKLILGFVWTLISKMVFSEDLSSNINMGFKSELLEWVKFVTRNYENVQIDNFTTSWKDGLGFNAIIHNFHPELVKNFYQLKKENSVENLEQAFSIAESHLGISQLIDVEDLTTELYPDEKSIMTYLMMFYEKFKDVEKVNNAKCGMKNLFTNLDLTFKERNIFKSKSENFNKNKITFYEEVEKVKEIFNTLLTSIQRIDKLNTILMKDAFDINSSYYSIRAFDMAENHKFDDTLIDYLVTYDHYHIDQVIDINGFNDVVKECKTDDLIKLENIKFIFQQYLTNETKSLHGKECDKDLSMPKVILELLESTYENKNNLLILPAIKKISGICFERIDRLNTVKSGLEENLKNAEAIFNKFSEKDTISFQVIKKIGHSINQKDFDMIDLSETEAYTIKQVRNLVLDLSFASYTKSVLPGIFKLLKCDIVSVPEISNEHYSSLCKFTKIGKKATVKDLSELLHK